MNIFTVSFLVTLFALVIWSSGGIVSYEPRTSNARSAEPVFASRTSSKNDASSSKDVRRNEISAGDIVDSLFHMHYSENSKDTGSSSHANAAAVPTGVSSSEFSSELESSPVPSTLVLPRPSSEVGASGKPLNSFGKDVIPSASIDDVELPSSSSDELRHWTSAGYAISPAPEVSAVPIPPRLSFPRTTPQASEDHIESSPAMPSPEFLHVLHPSPVSGADVVTDVLGSLARASSEPIAEVTPAAAAPSASASVSASASASPTPSPSGNGLPIHELSPTPTPTPTPAGACFPAHATVQTERGAVRMDKLKVGDSVLVANGRYSPVFMFTHKLSSVQSTFVRLRASSGHVIELSPSHYIYLNGRLAASHMAVVGDRLVLSDETNAVVSEVTSVNGYGLFNPQTLHGDIVVNGVKASTYTTAVQPWFAHALLAPVRLVYNRLGMSMLFAEGGLSAYKYVPQGAPIVLS